MRNSLKHIGCLAAIAICAISTPGVCRGQTQLVKGVDWSPYKDLRGVQPDDDFGKLIATVLQNQARYALRWVDSHYPTEENLAAFDGIEFYSPEAKDEYEGTVRPLAHFAWSNAVMMRTGIFDPTIAGISEKECLRRSELAIRGVAMTHRANKADGYTWGQGMPSKQSWQAAYWAAQAAEAAWMLWDDLSPESKDAVAKMVEFEANGLMDYKVPYWKSPNGHVNSPGDTKAEENAWNSRLLTAAQAMMPEHPNVERWRLKASELMISSYARPSDLTNTAKVDGKPVKEWLNGCNTFDDGFVVNHRILHPGYTTAHGMAYSTAIDATLSNQFIPESAFFNAQFTWDAMTKVNFTPGENPYGTGKNAPPGGTVYHKKADGTADSRPYFPHGNDWPSDPAADVDYVSFDVYSSILGLDAGQTPTAMDFASAQVNALRALQLRDGHDGSLFQAGDWSAAGDEIELGAQQDLAEAWLIWWLHQHHKIAPVSDHWGAVPLATEATAMDDEPATDGVMPWHMPEQNDPAIRKVQDRIYRLEEIQARQLLTQVHPWDKDRNLLLATESRSGETCIRANAATVEGMAFLYRFGPYDEKLVGVSRKDLFEKTVIPMMRYLVTTHTTGPKPTSDRKHWGDGWQSAYWAQMIGRAAWWTWDDLPDDLRRDVRRVIGHEADRFVGKTPPHQEIDDTKAEENAWNSLILNNAIVLMPSDPRRPAWEKEYQRWAMSAFLRAADEKNEKLVDGRPVSEQFTGANIHEDFTLENHEIVHPDYMGAFSCSLGCSLEFAMTGRKPPEALLYNIPEIYENLKWFVLPDGGYVFPNGQDWELFKSPDWMDVHAPMALYGRDPDAWSILLRCLDTTEKMQARDPAGPVYAKEEYFYEGQQHELFCEMDREWLGLQVTPSIVDRPTERIGVKRWETGKIVLNRTNGAVHTVSWGKKVMAQCVPLELDFVVSPDQESGVGHVRLKGEKKNLPLLVRSAKVVSGEHDFTVDLTLDHGENGVRAELEFHSAGDGSFTIHEKLFALGDITTDEIATGLIGVLNNPKWIYQAGSRKIKFDDREIEFAPLAGNEFGSDAVRRISACGRFEIASEKPLRVHYQGAKKIEDGRATDRLYLNFLAGQRSWKTGETISEYEATIRPMQ